jgi:hypothetical protein
VTQFKKKKENRNEWWDEGYRSIIQEKNEAKKKKLQTKTTASQELYKTERKEENGICT